jgi:hypothetical protein
MKMKWLAFVLTGMFFLPLISFSQEKAVQKETSEKSDSLNLKQIGTAVKPEPKPVLGKYDYYNHLGAACKAEFKLEKATKIPFRFRLGSLQQTDYMEQKPNAQKPD